MSGGSEGGSPWGRVAAKQGHLDHRWTGDLAIQGAGHPQPALLPGEGGRCRPDICCGRGCEHVPERDRKSCAVCACVSVRCA